MNTCFKKRFHIVEVYLKGNKSLREVAAKFDIPHLTLHRWVKWYREGGPENLNRRRAYKRPWNRPSKENEKMVVLLRERCPWLTVKMSHDYLEKQEIKFSHKKIRNIWKRHGLFFCVKNSPFDPLGTATSEVKQEIQRVKALLEQNRKREAAQTLNELDCCPEDTILKKVPVKYLKDRRKIEYFALIFGTIPFPLYCYQISLLRKKLKKKGLNFSALLTGFIELTAMQWMGDTERETNLINRLELLSQNMQDSVVEFMLCIYKGFTYARSNKIKMAKKCVNRCKRLISKSWHQSYYSLLGSLLTGIHEFKDASFYYQKALGKETQETKRRGFKVKLASCLTVTGEYSKATRLLSTAEINAIGSHSRVAILKGHCAIAKGDLQRASMLFEEAISTSRKEAILPCFSAATLGQAYTLAAQRRKKNAVDLIKRYIPLFRKHHLDREALYRSSLIHCIQPGEHTVAPQFRLISLLWKAKHSRSLKDYHRVIDFAQKKGMMGTFHRTISFFPEVVQFVCEKAKSTELPKTILRLPVFNREIPVYYAKILGHFVIYKNQKYIRQNLQPKDIAFLIRLSLKAGEPDKEIPLESIYGNFWKNSKNPSRNLSHLLVRIKKALQIPSHLIEVSYKKDHPVLINRGIHFITDYDEFQQSLAQAKALLRAGEWGFAKREFLGAFKLFRGEPFKKMYDDWSDDKRLEILFSYETEVLAFAKELLKRRRKEEAEKLLKRAEKIVPDIDVRPQT